MTRLGALQNIGAQEDFSTRPSVQVQGLGVHTGKLYSIEVYPLTDTEAAKLEAPILFTSRFEDVEFTTPGLWTRLSGTSRSTALVMRGESRRKLEIRTVEHFLAAAFILGLKARVEIQALGQDQDILEVPILDGACEDWIKILRPIMTAKKSTHQKVWVPKRTFEIKDGAKQVLISPWSEEPHKAESYFNCSVEFAPHWKQQADYRMDWTQHQRGRETFEKYIAPARTFGFMHEIKALEARGLALGGSLANAIVLDEDRVLNPGGFRIQNELACHKLLDAVGDFALLGAPLIGRIDLYQAGHSMHLRAIEEGMKEGVFTEGLLDSEGQLSFPS